jgi:aryl-alcohol dehydrogenase-like predicted oxidoreductase
MKLRELGTSGLTVSAIGLGCMGMSQSYGTPDEEEAVRTIHRALDLGVTLIDTADAYGKGANESLVGRAIRERRRDVVVASKFGLLPNPAGGTAVEVDARPARVRTCCEGSLTRLGVETIDLYYLHRVDPNVPIEDTVGAMADLVREGKVRFIGLSEAGPRSIRRAHATHPITALQSEYSLWTRDPEQTVFPVCRELGIGFVPFSPLSRGFLSGVVKSADTFESNDVRRKLPRFQPDNFERNLALLRPLEAIAHANGCSASQIALAWVLAKGPDLVPIPGTKRRRYLEENVAAAEITLSEHDVAALDAAFPAGSAAGTRYGAEAMRLLETEVDISVSRES